MTTDNVSYFVILTLMSFELNQYPHPPKQLTDTYSTQRAYIHSQQQTNFLGAHESLKRALGNNFRCRTLLFPSLTIYFLWVEGREGWWGGDSADHV